MQHVDHGLVEQLIDRLYKTKTCKADYCTQLHAIAQKLQFKAFFSFMLQ